MNIRKMTESDLLNLYGTLSDSEVMEYIEEPYTLDTIRVGGYRCDFTAWGILCACITCWAVSLEENEKKEKENK